MVRPTLMLMLVMALLLGLGYPGLGAVVAPYLSSLTDPGSYDGSLIEGPNGTSASALLGQNLTCLGYPNLTSCPYRGLFWVRPSMTDYEPFLGAGNESPYGATDPALVNETWAFVNESGPFNATSFTAGCGIPLDLVSQSGSGLDPDVTACAALVQIPRIAFYDNLTQAELISLVNAHTQTSGIPTVGPSYVNVVETDFALIETYGYNLPGA